MPASSPVAFQQRSAFINPLDGQNLNRSFPGKPKAARQRAGRWSQAEADVQRAGLRRVSACNTSGESAKAAPLVRRRGRRAERPPRPSAGFDLEACVRQLKLYRPMNRYSAAVRRRAAVVRAEGIGVVGQPHLDVVLHLPGQASIVCTSGTALDEYDSTMAESRNCVNVRCSASVTVLLRRTACTAWATYWYGCSP